MTSPKVQIISIGGTPYISAADASKISSVPQHTLARRARAGSLPALKVGRAWFIALPALRTIAADR